MRWRILSALCLLCAYSADAQQAMPSQAQQEQMMRALQQMTPEQMMHMQRLVTSGQECMSQIPGDQLQELQQRGQNVASQIDKLCKQGDRKAAARYARRQGEAFMQDPAIRTVRKCSAELAESLVFLMSDVTKGKNGQHVCDVAG